MRHGDATLGVFFQYQTALTHLGQVMLVDVEQVFVDGIRFARQGVGLDVHRVAVVVFRKRERKPFDRERAVGVGEIVPEGFDLGRCYTHGWPPLG